MKRVAGSVLLLLFACRARAPEPPSTPEDEVRPALKPEELPSVPHPLRMGLLPIFQPEELVKTYTPLAAYLGEALLTEVKIETSPDYASMVDRVLRQEVDLVQLAPLAYVVAKAKDHSLSLIATNISEGSSTYSGYILARADSPIRSVEDFRGKRFGFVDVDSTTGYLYPYAFFLEQGILPERDFKEVVMAKRHDLVIEELVTGKVDGAATFSGALLNAEAKGFDTDRIRIIAKTGRVPYDAWCTRGNLDPKVRDRIEAALLGLSTRSASGRKILAPLHSINGFARTNDAAYDDIRRVKRLVDAARE
jgi:phosphate/phosphite/phosphonate ABC transporter binding protein